MLLVRGRAGGTELTGTIYERGERAPTFRGAPEDDAAYVWVCDEFYEVESGGSVQEIDGRAVNVAFESPMPRGFDTREQALDAAREHVRTQFSRIGVDATDVDLTVEEDVELSDDGAPGEEGSSVDGEALPGDGTPGEEGSAVEGDG